MTAGYNSAKKKKPLVYWYQQDVCNSHVRKVPQDNLGAMPFAYVSSVFGAGMWIGFGGQAVASHYRLGLFLYNRTNKGSSRTIVVATKVDGVDDDSASSLDDSSSLGGGSTIVSDHSTGASGATFLVPASPPSRATGS